MKVQAETNRFRKQIDMKYTYQNNSSGGPQTSVKVRIYSNKHDTSSCGMDFKSNQKAIGC